VNRTWDDLQGRTIGPYRLLQRLGERGLGWTYKAYQPSMNRDVAILVVHPGLVTGETFRALFMEHAQMAARLDHVNIVSVYDMGCDGNLCYLVMELVGNESLADLLQALRAQKQLMALVQSGHIVQQVADALDYAHGQGVVHYDVKPSNILLGPDDHVLVTSFGLAQTVEAASGLDVTGIAIGTPMYESPEQLLGKKESIGPAVDIYSLGVVLYEMVTGQVPFTGENPLNLILKHLHDSIPLPSVVNPSLPQGVERVILKALAKQPADRHTSAGEMAQALAQAMQGLPEVQEGQARQEFSNVHEGSTATGKVGAAIAERAHRVEQQGDSVSHGHPSLDLDHLPIRAIRDLLTAAFTPQDLYRFCQDRPDFQPVVMRFGPGQGLDDMVDRVIDFCRTQFLWEVLLSEVAKDNPRQYARFEAYLHGAQPE
jgi:serine/threonine protein kinase